MIYDSKGEKISTPQIHVAPKYKDISHKLPKRPEEKLPAFVEMNEAELMAIMAATLKLKYDPLSYRSDVRYKAKVDSILMTGMVAMMTSYMRDKGVDVEAIFKTGVTSIEKPM